MPAPETRDANAESTRGYVAIIRTIKESSIEKLTLDGNATISERYASLDEARQWAIDTCWPESYITMYEVGPESETLLDTIECRIKTWTLRMPHRHCREK